VKVFRGSAENVTSFLSEKFDIYSVVKPGSDLNILTQSVKKDMNTLTNKDVAPIHEGQLSDSIKTSSGV